MTNRYGLFLFLNLIFFVLLTDAGFGIGSKLLCRNTTRKEELNKVFFAIPGHWPPKCCSELIPFSANSYIYMWIYLTDMFAKGLHPFKLLGWLDPVLQKIWCEPLVLWCAPGETQAKRCKTISGNSSAQRCNRCLTWHIVSHSKLVHCSRNKNANHFMPSLE